MTCAEHDGDGSGWDTSVSGGQVESGGGWGNRDGSDGTTMRSGDELSIIHCACCHAIDGGGKPAVPDIHSDLREESRGELPEVILNGEDDMLGFRGMMKDQRG